MKKERVKDEKDKKYIYIYDFYIYLTFFGGKE